MENKLIEGFLKEQRKLKACNEAALKVVQETVEEAKRFVSSRTDLMGKNFTRLIAEASDTEVIEFYKAIIR